MHPDYVMTHRMVPLAPGETWVECAWYFADEDVDPSYAVEFWDTTNRQDWAACESVQRGLSLTALQPRPARTQRGRRSPVRHDRRSRLPRRRTACLTDDFCCVRGSQCPRLDRARRDARGEAMSTSTDRQTSTCQTSKSRIRGRVVGPEDDGVRRRPDDHVRRSRRAAGRRRPAGRRRGRRAGRRRWPGRPGCRSPSAAAATARGAQQLDGGIVLDLRDLTAVEIDADGRTVWAGTGLTAGQLTPRPPSTASPWASATPGRSASAASRSVAASATWPASTA